MHGFVDIDKNDLFIVDCDRETRGHDLRIRKQHTVINGRLFHFSQRVIRHSVLMQFYDMNRTHVRQFTLVHVAKCHSIIS